MARERTKVGADASDESLPKGDGDTGTRTQDQRGRTGRMVADPPGLEEGSESAIDDAIRATGRHETKDTGNDDVVENGESVADLRRQLRRAEQRAEAAEGRSTELETKTAEALDGQTVANLNTLKSAKTQIEIEQKDLKTRLAQAHADGDFDAISEINMAMTQSAVRLTNIDNGIIALEQQPKQREALARRGEPGDQRYQQITKGMAPVAKQWFRDNPEYYKDDRLLKRVVAAVNLVMSDDDPPEENSGDYFERVEAELGRRDPKFASGTSSHGSGGGGGRNDPDETDGDARSDASGGQRRQADRPSGGAPPARNGRGTGSSDNGRSIRATRAEQEAAEIAGVTIEEYMENKRELMREDRIGPNSMNRNRMH